MVLIAGGTIDTFIDAVFNYPTLGDAYKYAAYDGLRNLEHCADGRSGGAPALLAAASD